MQGYNDPYINVMAKKSLHKKSSFMEKKNLCFSFVTLKLKQKTQLIFWGDCSSPEFENPTKIFFKIMKIMAHHIASRQTNICYSLTKKCLFVVFIGNAKEKNP